MCEFDAGGRGPESSNIFWTLVPFFNSSLTAIISSRFQTIDLWPTGWGAPEGIVCCGLLCMVWYAVVRCGMMCMFVFTWIHRVNTGIESIPGGIAAPPFFFSTWWHQISGGIGGGLPFCPWVGIITVELSSHVGAPYCRYSVCALSVLFNLWMRPL